MRTYLPEWGAFTGPDMLIDFGDAGGVANYIFCNNNPLVYTDPTGLWSWRQTFGVLRAGGGALEVAVGYSLASASVAFGAATSWTGVGLVAGAGGAVAGVGIGTHGLDQVQAGIREAAGDAPVDSFTSITLQKASGITQQSANLVDAGISVVGSAAAGVASASLKVALVRATDPLAKGATTASLLTQIEAGSVALNNADYLRLGGAATTPLAKAKMIEAGVDATGAAYKLTTTGAENLVKSIQLILTGPTPAADLLAGLLGAGSGVVRAVETAEEGGHE